MEGKVFLCFGVKEPKISHFHRFLFLSFNCIVDDADNSSVINVNGGS